MSLAMTWYTLEAVAEKYSLEKSMMLKWIEEGLLRSGHTDKGTVLVNIEDLGHKLRNMGGGIEVYFKFPAARV